MFVNFESLPNTSRVWVYQADRTLRTEEVTEISTKLKHFVGHWKRHGDDLKASFQIKYNQFVILAVDENYNDVSGCSIDASVHIIKELQQDLGINLLNKMKVTFKDDETINTVSLQDFKEYAKQQKITPNTIVFNNLVDSKANFETSWEVAASESWHARFLS